MVVVACWVGAGPSDDSKVVAREFELWSLDDCDVLSPVLRRKELREAQTEEEHGSDHDSNRHFCQESSHRTCVVL